MVCGVWCVVCGVCFVEVFANGFAPFHFISLPHTYVYLFCQGCSSVSFHFSLVNSHVSLLNVKLLSLAYALSLLLQ